MEYIKLGNSELNVSRLCLGCMSFGEPEEGQYQWTLSYDKSERIILKAYESGINFFDTSNNYSAGSSERFLGQALKNLDRSKLVITTKCYFNEGKLSPEAIHREVKGSLERLQMDYVDLLVLHRFDYDTPVEETLKALDEEVKMGHIRYYGASAMYGHQFAEYCYKARELGYQPFTTLQNHYNLIYREDERDLIPVAEQFGVSRTSFAPYAAGRLARKEYDNESTRFRLDSIEGTRYDKTAEADQKITSRVWEIAQKYGVSMSNICMAWQFAKGVAAPIIGVTKEKYLDDALNCFSVHLSEEDIRYLEELYVPHQINCNR
ncbi:MAG: aldo/keto reductase [Erysipelotrichaceae bacterium]|nr:aldo/keto reductase [Erysipelotrichaceae bacterium]